MKKQEIKTFKSFQQKSLPLDQLHKIKGGGIDNDCDGDTDDPPSDG